MKHLKFIGQNKAIAVLSSLVLLLAACEAPPTSTNNTEVTPTDTEAVDLEDVAEDTELLIGETVTVEGEVEEVIGVNVFRIEENDLFGGEQVLVINAASTPVVNEQNVRVTGEVRQFVLADLERDYDLNWDLEIEQQLEAEYQDKPVIVAESTELI